MRNRTFALPVFVARILSGLALSLVLVAAARAESASPKAGTTPEWIAVGKKAMVAADHPLASQVGRDILKAGGNAVDAAMGVSFALAVVRPQSSGLGGGGFAVIYDAKTNSATAYDYREAAPQAAHPRMYVDANRDTKAPPSRYGHLAVGVPGVVAGWFHIHERQGRLPVKDILAPVVRLAERGFPVDQHCHESIATIKEIWVKYSSLRSECGFAFEHYARSGDIPEVGDTIRQPQLAHLIQSLATEGDGYFYKGPVAEEMETQMAKYGGLITRKDMSDYKVIERKPLSTGYRSFRILTMPPPSSGVTLLEILNLLEPYELGKLYPKDPASIEHLKIEAMKHAFADRAHWLGDPGFSQIPMAAFFDEFRIGKVSSAMSSGPMGDINQYGLKPQPSDKAPADDHGTTHFCVVDAEGNCVSSTETINTSFGSLTALADFGLILNNEMDDFAAEPGKPNFFGLIQSERNAPQPGKRPLSSMVPSIVLQNGKPRLLIGASGGPKIITSVLNVTIDLLDLGMPLETAMTAPRVHHQWLPDIVRFDQTPDAGLVSKLTGRGHKMSDDRTGGVVQVILLNDGKLVGASDPKKGGAPSGY